jgi:thiamine biosynthesis lipoprotein
MRRRTLLSASLGLGSLAGLAWVAARPDARTGLTPYSGSALAFGTTVGIKVLHDDAPSAQAAIEDALRQVKTVDALMSLHQESSQLYQLNQRGRVDAPDHHLLQVLAFARQLSARTAGAFDITVQPLWQVFSRAAAKGTLPAPDELAAAKALVNWQHIEASARQVRLRTPGMAITLNGVAQGYAVDLALDALRAHGIGHALLDTGEFGSIGGRAADQPWMLGIRHPRQADALSAKLPLDGRMVATSGDYETFFTPDFVHHHIFDPVSGDSPPALASATVLAPTGMMADGLSTAFMVMGADQALALVAQWPEVDALLIDKHGAIRKTANFPALSA